MLLTLKLEIEKEIKKLLSKESSKFSKFLKSKNLDFEDLENEDELNELIDEYNKSKDERDKKIKNKLAVIALLILENVRNNFSTALKRGVEKKKLETLMSQMNLRKDINDFVEKTFKLYFYTPDRFFSTLKDKKIDNFEDTEELIERTDKTMNAYNTYYSIINSGGLYLNFENWVLKRIGVDSYIWRDVRDDHVRYSHSIRHGKRFDLNGKRLDGPQPDNKYINPKEEPGCRCSKFVDDSSIRKGVINAEI